jgi:DNA-binding GntR family transcriptional regulator
MLQDAGRTAKGSRVASGEGVAAAAARAGRESDGMRPSMLGDQIKEHLLAGILAGDFAPGERIVETRVARELGVSQGPVREALRDLATLGLVELQPYRGARVRRPDTDEIRQAMGVRAELEALAAAEACRRLGASGLAHLKSLVGEMVESAAAGRIEAYVQRNTEFHRALIRASGNRTLERLWEQLGPFARTYMTAAASGLDAGRIRRSHLTVVRALASRDPAAAAAAMREHSREAQELLRRRDAGQGESGIDPTSQGAGASRSGRRAK